MMKIKPQHPKSCQEGCAGTASLAAAQSSPLAPHQCHFCWLGAWGARKQDGASIQSRMSSWDRWEGS